MKTDTPKTDALCCYMADKKWIDHARKLERDNARLRDGYRDLLGQVVQARDGFGIYRNSPTMAKAIEDAEEYFFGENTQDQP